MQKGEQHGLRSSKGFTILEVLVAVVILGLAYVAILQNFSVSLRNIVRLEESSAVIFEDSLEFEGRIAAADETLDAGNDAGATFLEGSKFRLVLISSENNDFMTLKLEKL